VRARAHVGQVPRSIYDSSQSFADIGGRVFNGIRDIFTSRRGLGARETHHMFCRLLGAQVYTPPSSPLQIRYMRQLLVAQVYTSNPKPQTLNPTSNLKPET
jgi:hypothetical protein